MKRGRNHQFIREQGGKEQEYEEWEHHVKKLLTTDALIPIKSRPLVNKAMPFIVNMVGTVCILPQSQDAHGRPFRLPLEAIATHLGPCSQYAPFQFAANILKITNSTTDSTTLVFGSGKLVLVSALSEWHMRYVSQVFRLLIERIECIMVNEDNRLVKGTLQGRTVFEKSVAHNIVGHGNFGFNVDLRALREANPEAVQYVPDVFPAAKANVWLTPDQKCHCQDYDINNNDDDEDTKRTLGKVIKNNKCPCTIKCLVFKSGRMVLIGARRPQDINAVFYRIMDLVSGYKKNKKFYQALGSVLVKRSQKSQEKEKVKLRGERELSVTESIALVLSDVRDFKLKKPKPVSASSLAQRARLTPLMQLAEAGRLEQVKLTVEMDPDQVALTDDQGRTAEERLLLLTDRTPEHNAVIDFLQSI